MAFEPKQFGRFYLLEKLAVGGMAEIYKAKTYGAEGFEKLLAIKRILPHCSADKDFIRMLIDEAKLSVLLSHANIVQVYDLGKVGEDFFISMEFINGVNLRDILYRCREQKKQIPPDLAIYIMSEICKGLDYAHRKSDSDGKPLGIVHRDVSPQNVLISFEGEVKLVDFGIAKAAMNISHTMAGILKGKIAYMSPEQALGKPVDYRTDIFSSGIILYECLTGTKLFTGESQFEVLKKIRSTKITEAKLPKEIPQELRPVLAKALAYLSRERYQNAGDMQSELTRHLYSRYVDFTPKRLADFVRELFAGELERQQQQAIARHHREHPTASINVNEEMLQEAIVHRETDITDVDITPSTMQTSSIPMPPERSLTSAALPPRRSLTRLLAIIAVCAVLFGSGYALYRWNSERIVDPVPAEQVFGTLRVASTPANARILLDEVDMKQRTPALIEQLTLGKEYTVTVQKDGYHDMSQRVTAHSASPVRLDLRLEAATGKARITSDPSGATILLNGEATGLTTPSTLAKLPHGKDSTITIRKEGYKETKAVITADAAQQVTLHRKLQKLAPVQTPDEPGALQGPAVETPTPPEPSTPSQSTDTKPTPSEPQTAPADTGSLDIATKPHGAAIYLNGKDTGLRTPATLTDLPLGKKLTIQVKKDGFVGWARKLTLTPGKPSMKLSQSITKQDASARTSRPKPKPTKPKPKAETKPVKPTPPVTETGVTAKNGSAEVHTTKETYVDLGSVTISSKPKGATVYLDGKKFGRAPLTIDRVRNGSHTIRLEKKGYETWTQTVHVEPDTERKVHAPLVKKAK